MIQCKCYINIVILYCLGNGDKKILYIFSTDTTIVGLHCIHSQQCNIFLNIFDPLLVESVYAVLSNTEGWLTIYVERK